MKVRIKKTGILIDVIPKVNTNAQHSGDNLYVCDNMVFRECDLDFLNVENAVIDWEQRRYEIAKSMMAAFLSNSCSNVYMNTYENQAQEAVKYADALIEELKKGK